MNAEGNNGKILVVDPNIFFVKRVTEALRQQNFEVLQCADPAFALTMIEWSMPVAILCALQLHQPDGIDIPSILRADAKTSHIPVIAVGDCGQHSQLDVLRAGYEDLVDRRLGAAEIATHVVSIVSSRRDGFQPNQMLAPSETALDGRLSLVDLPGVIQMIAQSRLSGSLHINDGEDDGIIFFDSGEAIHAETGKFAGDDAVIHLVKTCNGTTEGVYKFIPKGTAIPRTVQGNVSGLILDALRQVDENGRATEEDGAGQDEPEDPPLTVSESSFPNVPDVFESGPDSDLDGPRSPVDPQPAIIETSDQPFVLDEPSQDSAADIAPSPVPVEPQSNSEGIDDVLEALGEQVFSSFEESDFIQALGGHGNDLNETKEVSHE